MPLSQTGSYTKSNMMPMSQTWSYTITHIGSYVMAYVLIGLYGRRNFVDTFLNVSFFLNSYIHSS
ncbi:hypothetical protein F383_25562 [Gossypium arboreum]|uniref:Uncharacterized protein n=1 Tax=Gossypium arboreum TaxID=29729 RepID=A0A0B0P613_GOSAR|nr:hypothetical protein F383_25562 [Gossypium arboreum]